MKVLEKMLVQLDPRSDFKGASRCMPSGLCYAPSPSICLLEFFYAAEVDDELPSPHGISWGSFLNTVATL